jgi:hypothetical protein
VREVVGLERIVLDSKFAIGCGSGTDFLDGNCALLFESREDCVGW